ncbi:hypothetical protein ACFLYD_08135 [Chloroflexota bacterium]
MIEPDLAVALAVTVHQPDERLAALVAAQLPGLMGHYVATAAYCSKETHPTIVGLLRHHGVSVSLDDGESAGITRIGHVRRQTVRAGLRLGTSHLQLCDFDRAIHWSATYPQELGTVVAGIPNYDLLVLGRTDRAWSTHPPYQTETEPLFNRVFALVTGLEWDVGAGSRGLSRRAAETLLESSEERTVGVDAEWPLLLLNRGGFRVGQRLCEGLEFETADRFGPEIEAAGDYGAWEARMSADPDRWVFRLRLALMIAEAVIRYGQSKGQ